MLTMYQQKATQQRVYKQHELYFIVTFLKNMKLAGYGRGGRSGQIPGTGCI